MHHDTPPASLPDGFRRTVLLVVMATSLLATLLAWRFEVIAGTSTPPWVAVQVSTTAALAILLAAAWFRWLPQRAIELGCLVCIVGVCAACMALGMYVYGADAGTYLQPLYLWIPLVYVFAFMLLSHKAGLVLSLAIFALFVGISMPYILRDLHGRYVNFTLQLHVASAVMIAMVYFFTSYQYRLRLAQRTVDQLAHLSNTDELTTLPNRRHMAATIRTALAGWVPGGRGIAVFLFDIDHFKGINDRDGHAAGDRTLVALARCAQELFGGMGALGRWGGDEFVAIVQDASAEDATRMAEALCAHVEAAGLVDGLRVTLSCGVTVVRPRDSLDSLLQRADAALYKAKRAGRNRAEVIVEEGVHAGVR